MSAKVESKTMKMASSSEDEGQRQAGGPKKEPTKKKQPSKKESRGSRYKKPHRMETYSSYIYKVLAQVHGKKSDGRPAIGITAKAMSTVDSFVNDMFERLSREANTAARLNKKATLSSREIQTAVRLLLPGQLAKHAVSEGTKAVTTYTSSRS